jgi:hypothetical protein
VTLLDPLHRLVADMRRSGVAVPASAVEDAARGLAVLADFGPAEVRSTLRCTLAKDRMSQKLFELFFGIWFAGGQLPAGAEPDSGFDLSVDPDELSDTELADAIREALRSGDRGQLEHSAKLAARRWAGINESSRGSGALQAHHVIRQLGLDQLQPFDDDDAVEGPNGTSRRQRQLDLFRLALEVQVRKLLVAVRGAADIAQAQNVQRIEDKDVLRATRAELEELEAVVSRLSRTLAVRMRRRRRHRDGRLDVRSTLRRSLATGGVPIDARFTRRRPRKPEVVVVCDVSGSVANFARFTLLFAYALAGEFRQVRSFVFVDGVDEVTNRFRHGAEVAQSLREVLQSADVVRVDGHSDYGRAFGELHELLGSSVNHRTTVVVLGDARNNYHSTGEEAFAELAGRAHRVWWMNPEPRTYWNTGDSVIERYAPYCDEVVEVRTVRQLARFIDRL